MKTKLATACVAGLCILALPGMSQAQTRDDFLRLEAKLDALAKENAALRARMSRFESRQTAAAPAQLPVRQGAVRSAPASDDTALTAQAADFPAAVRGPSGCAALRFQGAYAGIHGGAANHTAHRTDRDAYILPFVATYATKSWGGVIGGQAGYNWANCNTLWGVEIDGSWASTEASLTLANFPGIVAQVRSRVDGLGTARVRGGVVVDNLLLYLTGGVALARTRTEWSTNVLGFAPTETLSSSKWRWGWVAGVGAEWAWTDQFKVRSEALYVDLADRNYTMFSNAFAAPTRFRDGDSMWIARVGLNYTFAR